jgi:hypothetical protein
LVKASNSTSIETMLLLCSHEHAFLEANGHSIPGKKIVMSLPTSSQAAVQANMPHVYTALREALLETILERPYMDQERDEELVTNMLAL